MFKQIRSSFNKYSSNVAYIYDDNNNVPHCQTYGDLNNEIQHVNTFISAVPEGALIGVQLGKMPCLLPVVYSLLEHKLAFILLEAQSQILEEDSVKPYALIKCGLHGSECVIDQHVNANSIRHKIHGCSYIFHKLKWLTVEETEKCLCYQGICYVIKTSGTLGKQKVVKVTENSIYSNITSFITLFDITEEDVIYFGTPLSFDPCLIELFLALTTGACLFVTSKQIRNNPQQLVDTLFVKKICCKSVTFMQMCPSMFLQFSAQQIDFILNRSGLRTLGLGGEQFPIHILPEMPKAKIYNFYGITEVSCWSSVERMLYGNEVCLGDPLDETLFQIKKTDGTLVNLWENSGNTEIGEELEGVLNIGSETRICYIDNEDEHSKDIAKRCQFTFRSSGDVVKVKNGKIYFVGRETDVIKRFGQRISPMQTQMLICTSTQLVNQCIFHKDKLFCFLKSSVQMTNDLKSKTIDKIRVKLLKSLPSKLMPDYFEFLTDIPTWKHNGKLNIDALKECGNQLLMNAQKPSNKSRIALFEHLWHKHCGVVVYTSNFWDSGGTSISAMQMVQEYESVTNSTLNRSVLDAEFQTAISFINENDSKDGVQLTHGDSVFKPIWKTDMKACIDSSPVTCSLQGQSYVAVGNFAETFTVFHAESGLVVASIDLPNVIESSCLVDGEMFYVPCFDGKLHCFQLTSEEGSPPRRRLNTTWTFKTGNILKTTPILADNKIIFGSYDGYIYAVTKDGHLKWKTILEAPITAEVKYSNEKLFTATLRGRICCLSIKWGSILWIHPAPYPIFTSPALSKTKSMKENILFVDIQGNIYCFLIHKEKSLLWTFCTRSSPAMKTFGVMAVLGNRILLGTDEGNLNIFNFTETSCHLEHTIAMSSASITTKPLILTIKEETYMIVVSSAGIIHLYHFNGGAQFVAKGVYSLKDKCFSSPQLCNTHKNRIYLGCRNNHLHCIEINPQQ